MAVSVKFSTMTGFHICMLILWLYCDGWTVGIHCGCFTRPGGSGWRQWGLVGGRMCQIPWCCHSVSLHSPVMVFRQILIHGITYKTQGTVGKSLFERLIQILISQMAFLVQLNGPNRSGVSSITHSAIPSQIACSLQHHVTRAVIRLITTVWLKILSNLESSNFQQNIRSWSDLVGVLWILPKTGELT